jgi:hypothetical protein
MLARLRTLLLTTPALVTIGLVLAYLLFGWFGFGPLAQWGAEKYVADKTGHHLTMDQPKFDPLGLKLTLSNVRLTEPDGQLLAGFKELFVDFEASSLFRFAYTFDTIRLVAPQGNLALLPCGKLNWTPFIEAFNDDDKKDDKGPPRLLIRHFELKDGRLDFADKTVQPAFTMDFKPLDLTLDDLSTLPDNKGAYQVSARTILGATLRWKGDVALKPVAASGAFSLEGIQLAQLDPYLKGHINIAAPTGQLGISTNYRFTYDKRQFGLTLDQTGLTLDGLRLRGPNEAEPALAVDHFAVKGGRLDLASHRIELGEVSLDGGQANLTRLADGRYNIQNWLPTTTTAAAPTPAQPSGPATPWQIGVAKVDLNKLGLRLQGAGIATPILAGLGGVRVEQTHIDLAAGKAAVQLVALDQGQFDIERAADGSLPLLAALASNKPASSAHRPAPASKTSAAEPGWTWTLARAELNEFGIAAHDLSVKPAAGITVEHMNASVEGLSQDLKANLPVKLGLKIKEGGELNVQGTLDPAQGTLDAQVDLAGLNLTPAQPYVAQAANLTLASGRLGSKGHLKVGGKTQYQGGFQIGNLMVRESRTGDRFLAWRNLSTASLRASPDGLNIGELKVDGLGAKLIIHKDKSTNLQAMMKAPPVAPAPAKPAPTIKTEARPAPAKPGFRLGIERIHIVGSEMDFADESLALPFGTRIHGLKGYVNGISNQSGAPARIQLDGLVDDYGLARADGQMDLLNPTGFTDVKVVFKNVEMTRLTPYSATFAGRKIDSGKLSLDLEYKIKDRQLEGENQIVMDRLTLGERVESPTAKDLPLDLAIAILQDSDGRIDLGLPVSGSLDDPQFSYGRIIWKAIFNLIGKIALAPFRALGSLFGGSGEKLENVIFDAGAPGLQPPEKEKLKKVAQVLNKRPRLALTVQGGWSPEVDGLAIREQRVRHALAETMGRKLAADEDPGPIALADPKTEAALEKLYAARIGSDALKSLKSKFEQANPGAPPTSATGRLLSKFSSLVKAKPAPISADEAAQLKGADLYELLYRQLVAKEAVTEASLIALGKARGDAMLAELAAEGAPADRLVSKPPVAITGATGHDVPIKLTLGVASLPASAPVAQPVH